MEHKINVSGLMEYKMSNRIHFTISIYLVFRKYGKQKMPMTPILKADSFMYYLHIPPTLPEFLRNLHRMSIQKNPQEYKICLQSLKMFL